MFTPTGKNEKSLLMRTTKQIIIIRNDGVDGSA